MFFSILLFSLKKNSTSVPTLGAGALIIPLQNTYIHCMIKQK